MKDQEIQRLELAVESLEARVNLITQIAIVNAVRLDTLINHLQDQGIIDREMFDADCADQAEVLEKRGMERQGELQR